MFRACITSTIALAATLALAGGASAATFCVTPESSCAPAQTYPTFTDALTAAAMNAGLDKIVLGAATYTAPTTAGFEYADQSPGGAIEIAGQGTDTVLTAPSGATHVLYVHSAASGSTVVDLKVHLPASVATFGSGIKSDHAELAHVTVDADPTQSDTVSGIELLNNAILGESTVTLDDSGSFQAIGVNLSGPGTVVRDATISGYQGIVTTAGGTIASVRIAARGAGIEVANDVPVLIRNSLVRMVPSQGQTGIEILSDSTVTIAGCTLIGNGSSQSVGILASSNNANSSADIANVVIHGFDSALQRLAAAGSQTTLAIHNSDYDPSNLLASGSGATNQGAGNGFHSDPGFVDEAGGDYSLSPGSPLIDAGDPLAPVGSADLDENQRVVGAAPDIGALEYQGGGVGGGGGGGGGGGSDDDPAPASDPAATVADVPGQSPSSNDPQPPAAGPAHLPPVITRLRVHGRWVRLTINEAATIDVRIERRSRTAARVVRHQRVAATKAGALKIRLRHLRAGRYRIVVTATDAFGNRSAPKARKLVRR